MRLTLLGVLALVAAASIAVFANAGPQPFDLAASPSSQTVTPGQTATYAIALNRHNTNNGKFTDPVALSATGLPPKSQATFHPTPVSESKQGSALTIETNVNGNTPSGTYKVKVTGTAAGGSDWIEVTLVVLPPSAPNFVLLPRETERTITDDDDTSFTIDIDRNGIFTGAVSFSVSGLPARTSAQFTPSFAQPGDTAMTLNVAAEPKAKAGTYPLLISGIGQLGSSLGTRYTAVMLVIEDKKAFSIAGEPEDELAPGAEAPIDLALSNPHNFEILVRELNVSIDPHTGSLGCPAAVNFGAEQIPANRYPITLPARSTRTLSELGFSTADMPAATMHNLDVDQEACKGVQVHLQYSGLATKK